ncbi:sulfur carrier protein ThiS adenylyltransferase ThiF [Oleidesulfovibrio sp.]|uniref:sulfur carrier protein ThiS adenylyltransferase ThiF n=1 Tax=Oleidesulfovibrio sp. TaxID=2909707 RepID=UPI003A8B3B90
MGDLLNGLQRHLTCAQIAALQNTTVGIAGAGGLGSNCAAMLVRSGVRKLVLADYDRIEPSNLNRQWFTPDQLGMPKVQALADNLRKLEPELDLHVYEQKLDLAGLTTIFDGCDVLVEAVDDAEVKSMIAAFCLSRSVFFVSASGMAGWGGPVMISRPVRDAGVIVGDMQTAVSDALPPMAPRVIMAAAMQADAVLCRILGACSCEGPK